MKPSDIYILSFSGGKDSAATLLYLLKEKGLRPHVVFCDTGNETPETYRYVDYISGLIESWGYFPIIKLKGEYDFYSLAKKKKRFPSIKARFCTEWLKIVPKLRWIEEQGFKDYVMITGIRRAESRAGVPGKSGKFQQRYMGKSCGTQLLIGRPKKSLRSTKNMELSRTLCIRWDLSG